MFLLEEVARPGRFELPTLCLEGSPSALACVRIRWEVAVISQSTVSRGKPVQTHLSRYPLQFPLQSGRAAANASHSRRNRSSLVVHKNWAQCPSRSPKSHVIIQQSISAAREDSLCFLAEYGGKPGAAGVLCIHDGVALFGGSATIPELRRRGLQAALLHKRMCYAFDHGCDLAMMVAQPGSDSQRNAERKGFRIAYTRTKWRLCS